MIDWILKFEWNGMIGILLYWVPALFCVVFYTIRTAEGYMTDRRKRDEADGSRDNPLGKFYVPRETIGGILGRALVSVIPVANIWAALTCRPRCLRGCSSGSARYSTSRLCRSVSAKAKAPAPPQRQGFQIDRSSTRSPDLTGDQRGIQHQDSLCGSR
jgi:hypothetical protein